MTQPSAPDRRPTVRFTYEYDGTEYASTSVFPSAITSNYDTESAARAVVRRIRS